MLKGHARFRTGSEEEDESTFHFVDNRSIPLNKKVSFRVFPEGPVKVILSKTRDQLNNSIIFYIEEEETTVEGVGCNFDYLSNESSATILKLNSINDIEISITKSEINYQDRIVIKGLFEDLKFIGFDSDLQASWIVQKSNLEKKYTSKIDKPCTKTLIPKPQNPGTWAVTIIPVATHPPHL